MCINVRSLRTIKLKSFFLIGKGMRNMVLYFLQETHFVKIKPRIVIQFAMVWGYNTLLFRIRIF